METKKWVTRFIAGALLIIGIVSGINLIVNPYNVFGHGLDSFAPRKEYVLSDRMSKFYIANRLEPKTIMMGTSRIGLFGESQLAPYLEGPIYNASMAGSTIDEQAAYIRYMVGRGDVKNVVWSLDFFSFNPTKPIDPAFEAQRLSETPYLNDYLISLFSFKTLTRSFKTVKKNRFSVPEPDETTGQPFTRKRVDFNINYILRQYATDVTFLKSEIFKNPSSIDPKLALVRETVQFCKERNVTCTLYTSPVFYRHMDMVYGIGLGATFEYWKKGLAGIQPYTDFCTYSALSKEPMKFRDSSHVIGEVGELVFARLFADRHAVPDDFGILVTAATAEAHVARQRQYRQHFSTTGSLSGTGKD